MNIQFQGRIYGIYCLEVSEAPDNIYHKEIKSELKSNLIVKKGNQNTVSELKRKFRGLELLTTGLLV